MLVRRLLVGVFDGARQRERVEIEAPAILDHMPVDVLAPAHLEIAKDVGAFRSQLQDNAGYYAPSYTIGVGGAANEGHYGSLDRIADALAEDVLKRGDLRASLAQALVAADEMSRHDPGYGAARAAWERDGGDLGGVEAAYGVHGAWLDTLERRIAAWARWTRPDAATAVTAAMYQPTARVRLSDAVALLADLGIDWQTPAAAAADRG